MTWGPDIKEKLRILNIEDNSHDHEIIRAKLDKEGIEHEMERVDTLKSLMDKLEKGGFDLILSDFNLPDLDGLSALEIVRAKDADIPFIFVTGFLGEELAVEMLKKGATDYVLKDRLSRLVPVMKRAIEGAYMRKGRRRAEEALRDSESFFRQLVSSLPQLVLTFHPDGSCNFLSRQWVAYTGIPETPQLGYGWLEQLHPYDRTPAVAAWQTAMAFNEAFRLECRIRRHDGEYGWFDTQAVRLRDEEGHTVKWFVFSTDITERKQTEMKILALNEELEQRVRDRTEELNNTNAELNLANRAKDSFLATMSHEIRTPLSGLLGMLELLSLTPLNSGQKKTLQAAWDSGKGLLRILSDILDWSKIEAGKLRLLPQATSLSLLLNEVVTTYSHVVTAKGLSLRQHADVRLSPAHLVDSLRLLQILNNFVSNAIKFTNKGEVEVRAELLDRSDGAETVRFSVRDTGIGIDQEQQSWLFKEYAQATAGTARMYGGTGLGLAISRRLADLMQGRIELASTPGQGSTFSITLTLPVTERETEQSAAEGAEMLSVQPIVQDGATAATVLVVDDNPVNLALLVRQVELLGLRARGAEEGKVALAIWLEGGISLVITDIHMPGIDGYELTASIRRFEIAEARPRMPVIASTANALSEENERCHSAGIDEVLVKPITLMKLRATLLRYLPELRDVVAATPVHIPVHIIDGMDQIALHDAGVPVDYAGLQKIIPDRAGQISLLSKFRMYQQTDIKKLMEEFEKGDLAAMALTAHYIKGAAIMIGAKDLASAYDAVEQAAKQNDPDGARTAMHTLIAAVNRFEAYLFAQTDVKEKTA